MYNTYWAFQKGYAAIYLKGVLLDIKTIIFRIKVPISKIFIEIDNLLVGLEQQIFVFLFSSPIMTLIVYIGV